MKENRLKSGEKHTVITIPKSAVIQIQRLKTVNVFAIRKESLEACAFEISRTALSVIPKEEMDLIRFNPDKNKPFNPIPAVPMSIATAFPLIRVIKILKT